MRSVLFSIVIGILSETGVMTWSPWHPPGFVLLALVVGFLVTLTVALLPTRFTRRLDPDWITRTGAVSVAAIALGDLGLPIPAGLPFGLLLGGVGLPPIRHVRFVRHLRCRRLAAILAGATHPDDLTGHAVIRESDLLRMAAEVHRDERLLVDLLAQVLKALPD